MTGAISKKDLLLFTYLKNQNSLTKNSSLLNRTKTLKAAFLEWIQRKEGKVSVFYNFKYCTRWTKCCHPKTSNMPQLCYSSWVPWSLAHSSISTERQLPLLFWSPQLVTVDTGEDTNMQVTFNGSCAVGQCVLWSYHSVTGTNLYQVCMCMICPRYFRITPAFPAIDSWLVCMVLDRYETLGVITS